MVALFVMRFTLKPIPDNRRPERVDPGEFTARPGRLSRTTASHRVTRSSPGAGIRPFLFITNKPSDIHFVGDEKRPSRAEGLTRQGGQAHRGLIS
jgi:hypothetical protein